MDFWQNAHSAVKLGPTNSEDLYFGNGCNLPCGSIE
jgi:hypothetical protein